MHKRTLQLLFAFILVSLTAFNLWVEHAPAGLGVGRPHDPA